jgi:hypothetical protein
MKVVLIQYETRDDRALRLLMHYTREYCEKHGYEYYCPEETFDLPTYWIKVALIQRIFQRTPADTDLCVAWIDSDAVFVREETRIEKLVLDSQHNFVASLDPGSSNSMNAGVFFVRRTPTISTMMNEWMKLYSPDRWQKTTKADGTISWKTNGRWAGPDYEQGAFNEHILPHFQDQIVLLPEKVLACYEPVYRNDTIVCHFMYNHKWKIWIYNTLRRLPEVAALSAVIALAVVLVRNR